MRGASWLPVGMCVHFCPAHNRLVFEEWRHFSRSWLQNISEHLQTATKAWLKHLFRRQLSKIYSFFSVKFLLWIRRNGDCYNKHDGQTYEACCGGGKAEDLCRVKTKGGCHWVLPRRTHVDGHKRRTCGASSIKTRQWPKPQYNWNKNYYLCQLILLLLACMLHGKRENVSWMMCVIRVKPVPSSVPTVDTQTFYYLQ